MNTLEVFRVAPFGVYLDGGEAGSVLLSAKEAPEDAKIGDKFSVFVYPDKDDCLIGTFKKPLVMIGQCANLRIVSVDKIGVFLDWGLPKDLFLPYGELRREVKVGDSCIVCPYIDNQGRITASSRVDRFIETEASGYQRGQLVDLLIVGKTDLGFKAVVNHKHWGILFSSDLFTPLRSGQSLKGYIKQQRPDGRLDLTLTPIGSAGLDKLATQIIERLDNGGGFSPLADKSDPEAIYNAYGVSKKAYKSAIGGLLKKGLIRITPEGIYRTK